MKNPKEQPRSIDEYIAGFPEDVQEILQKIRSTGKSAAPDAEEAVKYGIPTFVLNGNMVHFGGFQKHIGFYPTPSELKNSKTSWLSTKAQKALSNFRSTNRCLMT